MALKNFAAGSIVLAVSAALTTPALAQSQDDRIAALERLVAAQAQRISELERKVERGEVRDGGQTEASPVLAARMQEPPQEPGGRRAGAGPAPVMTERFGVPGLDVSGDIRVRYEQNWSNRNSRERGRGVLRARLGASYRIDEVFSVGARLVTGDPDDPNTADVTLSAFADDLTVALDQAYVSADLGAAQVTLGKVPQPFRKTDLVWDDDVNPQGVSAALALPIAAASRLELRGLYFIIDESALGPDSDMWGAQAALVTTPSAKLELSLAAAYFDYSIRSIAGADEGDFRGNRRLPSGGYLSDFNLIDVLASARWTAFGDRWPLSVTADYVTNRGAFDSQEDEGYAVLTSLGRTAERGDWQLGYGYLQADADAVLAAFSHDNIGLSTDYLLHAFSIDYVLRRNAILNATFYHYRAQHSALPLGVMADWQDRLRMNLTLKF